MGTTWLDTEIPSLSQYRDSIEYNTTNVARNLKYRIIKQKLLDPHPTWLTVSLLGITEYGFVNNELRRQCWSVLLNNQFTRGKKTKNKKIDIKDKICLLQPEVHNDYNQVQLDTNRSFGYIKDPNVKARLKETLQTVIMGVLTKNPGLSYYQGYHDIASVFVMVFYDEKAINQNTDEMISLLHIFTLLYLRDFMMDSLDFAIDQIKVIPQIISKSDKRLVNKLKLDKQDPLFAISSILTLYSHHFKPQLETAELEFDLIYEIFDLIIATQSMMLPLVMYSKFLLLNKELLYKEYELNLVNFENLNDLVHVIVQKIIMTSLTMGDDLNVCRQWYSILNEVRLDFMKNKVKVPSLKRSVNKYSPLLTTTANVNLNTLELTTYKEEDLQKLLKKAISLNVVRKNMNGPDINKLYRQQNYPFLIQMMENKYRKMPPLVKMSIIVGIMAMIIRVMDKENRLFYRFETVIIPYFLSTLKSKWL